MSKLAKKTNGQGQLDYAQVREINSTIIRRRREFGELERFGRTLITIPARGTVTGKDSSGELTEVDLHKALPYPLTLLTATGKEIEPAGNLGKSFWADQDGLWAYRGFLEKYPGIPLLRVRGTDRVVACLDGVGPGGFRIIFPEPNYARPKSDPVAALLSWLNSLQNSSPDETPTWLADYVFPESDLVNAKLRQLEEEMADLLTSIDLLKGEKAADDRWRKLLTSHGIPLEILVREALENLGFEIDETIDGRADLRMTYRGEGAVFEVKGISKSAAEKHSAQLEKWAAAEVEAGNQRKPILVINSWRLIPPTERSQESFPHQMQSYAIARNHCLVTTTQLLVMLRTVLRDPAEQDRAARALLDTTGVVSGWELDETTLRHRSE